MGERIGVVIRIALSLALLVGVYGETGVFTTTALALAMIGMEAVGIALRRR